MWAPHRGSRAKYLKEGRVLTALGWRECFWRGTGYGETSCHRIYGFLRVPAQNMSAVLTFFRAMILNPHVVAKAQDEIDRVVGRDRLPCIDDKPNLPYVRSVAAEVLRYAPSVPLGVSESAKGRWCRLNQECRYSSRCDSRRLLRWIFHPQRQYHLPQHLVSWIYTLRVCQNMTPFS
jgi:hypothetical protein